MGRPSGRPHLHADPIASPMAGRERIERRIAELTQTSSARQENLRVAHNDSFTFGPAGPAHSDAVGHRHEAGDCGITLTVFLDDDFQGGSTCFTGLGMQGASAGC